MENGQCKKARDNVMLLFSGVLTQLQEGRTQLEELWNARRLKLDLCLQLRLFEREALEVRNTLKLKLYILLLSIDMKYYM